MNKNLLKLASLSIFALTSYTASAQRFLTEVFPSVNVTTNVTYYQNYTVFPPAPTPTLIPLTMDVYEPAGAPDPLTARPLMIYLHTGSYLPAIINSNATGNRNDSASAEMCRQFARRGYVVANIDYRLGWDPANSNLDVRRGTLLNAVYRSIQDVKAAVRYFRQNADVGGNTYGIDANNVFLCGQGTGGYIAINYAVLNDPLEITLPKFISSTTVPAYGLTAGQPYVNQLALGDFDGNGGVAPYNNPNTITGYSTAVQFAINLGGAMGDSSWIAANDAPMVAFHCVDDPFAPYGVGIVYVPTSPPQSVVDVIGSGEIIKWANQLGNNNCFIAAGFNDPYTLRANSINGGQEGLFPLIQSPNSINPAFGHAGPWEWFDLGATQQLALTYGYPLASLKGDTCFMNSYATNPNMSKNYALAYIDTIMNYVNPRIVYCRNLPTGINEVSTNSSDITIYNSTAKNYFTVSSTRTDAMRKIELIDIKGAVVTTVNNPNAFEQRVTKAGLNLNKGVFFVRITFGKEVITKKLILN